MLRRLQPKLYERARIYAIFLYNRLFGYRREKSRFLERMGYPLDLKAPRSFSEKVVWKKLNDRNPLLKITASKYQVRNYIKEVLGEREAQRVLIPLLWHGKDPSQIPFGRLPQNFVVKASHGSGWNLIVRGGRPGPAEIIEKCRCWMAMPPYGLEKQEWAYLGAERRIVIEQFLADGKGKVPNDFKFFMIHGKCRMILVDVDRFEGHSKTLYDSEWMPIAVRRGAVQGPPIERPKNLERMLDLAHALSQDFDFVRVDLYSLEGKVYFGELTHYPAAGNEPFDPRSFDYELGAYWDLERNYWKNKGRSRVRQVEEREG